MLEGYYMSTDVIVVVTDHKVPQVCLSLPTKNLPLQLALPGVFLYFVIFTKY